MGLNYNKINNEVRILNIFFLLGDFGIRDTREK